MDVVHVVEASGGGVARHVLDLLGELHRLGVDQALIYSPLRQDTSFATALPHLVELGIPVVPVPMVRHISPWRDLVASLRVRKILKSFAPKVLHLHSSKAGGVGRLAALSLPGVRVVYTPNSLSSHISSWYSLIEVFLGRLRTDALVAVSASELKEMVELRLASRRRIHQIDSGVDADQVRALAHSPCVLPGWSGPTVCTAGRLTRQKDPLLLVQTARLVLQEHPNVRFVWVGDGELRNKLEAELEQSGLRGNWLITGWLSNPYPIMAAADVFVLTSQYESFGYVTLEAMALERPVVATRVVGSVDLVEHRVTGLLTDPGSATHIARAISELLVDSGLRRTLGMNGGRRAERFSLDRMAFETLRLYGSLCEALRDRFPPMTARSRAG